MTATTLDACLVFKRENITLEGLTWVWDDNKIYAATPRFEIEEEAASKDFPNKG